MSKKIIMVIPLLGISKGARGITVETTGFAGTACQDATAALKQALGAVTSETLTSEYFETEERLEFLNHGDKPD